MGQPILVQTMPIMIAATLLLCWSAAVALADCECGYTIASPSANKEKNDNDVLLFTDLLETDFTRLVADNDYNNMAWDTTDWAPQAFNLTAQRARGEYGEMFDVGNVGLYAGNGPGQQGQQGLRLVVKHQVVDGMVPVAELDTRRLDIFWGTFRALMKISKVPGTCAAFFWVS
jgi:hypothetical protein